MDYIKMPNILEHNYKWLDYTDDKEIKIFLISFGKYISKQVFSEWDEDTLLYPDEINDLDRTEIAEKFFDDNYPNNKYLSHALDVYQDKKLLIEDMAQRVDWQLPRAYLRQKKGDKNPFFVNGVEALYYQLPKRKITEIMGDFEDTKEKRKLLGLPITKKLRYMRKKIDTWEEIAVEGYKVVEIYKPSQTASLLIKTEEGEEIRILSLYFAEMQKPSFVADLNKEIEEE